MVSSKDQNEIKTEINEEYLQDRTFSQFSILAEFTPPDVTFDEERSKETLKMKRIYNIIC